MNIWAKMVLYNQLFTQVCTQRKTGDSTVMLLVCVDDILIAGTSVSVRIH